MRGIPRGWWIWAAAALVGATLLNLGFSWFSVDHDPLLVTLLALALVATGAVVHEALVSHGATTWTTPRTDRAPETGEDLRTEELRWVVEAHLSSRGADDGVVWTIADLADRRLRQVHGLRYADDPHRATELLGPVLADWVSHDRRHRYDPAHRHARYSVAQLDDIVRRIEEL
jgi:hypothetical protein